MALLVVLSSFSFGFGFVLLLFVKLLSPIVAIVEMNEVVFFYYQFRRLLALSCLFYGRKLC